MRYLLLVPLCLAAAACSSGDDGGAANAAAAEEAPATMAPGQYAVEAEVKSFRSTDNQKPVVDAKVGDKSQGGGCVAAGAPPPPQVFAGEGYQCSYKNSYIKSGMINASLSCTKKGVTGEMAMNVDGTYTAKGFDAEVETTTFLPGNGDFEMKRKLSGKLTGPGCAPVAPDAGADKAGANASAPAG